MDVYSSSKLGSVLSVTETVILYPTTARAVKFQAAAEEFIRKVIR